MRSHLRKMLYPVLFSLLLLLVTLPDPPAVRSLPTTDTATLNPVADSHVEEVSPDVNFGGESFLEVADATGASVGTKMGYIMFDLSGVYPPGATIDSAQLQLYVSVLTETHEVGVHYCSDNSWVESEITWSNRPAFEASVIDTTTVDTQGVWCSWTLTETVRTALSRGAKLTVVIKSEDKHEGAKWVQFYSREETGLEPKLMTTWSWTPPPDTEPPEISGLRYQPIDPTPVDDVVVTCSVIDLLSSRSYTFETGIGPDWTVLGGNWFVEGGELGQNQTEVDPQTAGVQKLLSVYTYDDFVLVTKAKVVSSAGTPHVGLAFRFVGSDNFYELMLRGGGYNDVYFQKKVGGAFSPIGNTSSYTLPTGTWITLKIVVSGEHFEGYVDDVLMVEATDDVFTAGQTGLSTPFTYARFDDVELSLCDGSGVEEVGLFYRVDGGSWNEVTMEDVGDSSYEARIPKQEVGVTVSFYVEAVDKASNKAESDTSSYEVTKISTSISCSVSADKIALGGGITVSGVISPARGNVTVTITYTDPDGVTVTRTVISNATGGYSDTYHPDKTGRWTVVASWAGDEVYEGATSVSVSFDVEFPWMLTSVGVVAVVAVAVFYFLRIRKREV